MSMKISKIIRKLEKAKEQYGDLPVYANEADIAEVKITACNDDSTVTVVDGVQETPTEFYLEFEPGMGR